MDVATLADLLHETAERHGPFEARAPKHEWWDWYAPYLDGRLHGSMPVDAARVADRYMKEVRHVVRVETDRLNRILVATDGSATALEAVAFAVDLAAEHGSELIILHVVPLVNVVPPLSIYQISAAFPHVPSAYDHELLDEAAALAAAEGVVATTALVPGTAVAEIASYAESHDADLVVVGSHGHGAVLSALHGSVAWVIHAAKRSVLIVRPTHRTSTTRT